MKATVTLFAMICTAAFAQEKVTLEQQANLKAETQLAKAFSEIRPARAAVISAIDAIGDPKKREFYRTLFEKNEKAWDDLIGSTALLQQQVKDASAKPDIRYTRILEAEYSEFRIKQYQDFARWIELQK